MVVGFVIGICASMLVSSQLSANDMNLPTSNGEGEGQLRTQGKYTSPLLECYGGKPLSVDVLSRLEREIDRYVRSQNKASFVSIYFRDLTNGGSFEVGDEVFYKPASLMKLPTVIAAYKKIESDASFADKRVTVTTDSDVSQTIKSGPSAEVGDTYTVLELIDKSIRDSDNVAHSALIETVGPLDIEQVLADFNVPQYSTANEYALSPRTYASFFRILYNATYLSDKNSENLLSLLANTNFRDGLRASVPEEIEIAHKFGERAINYADGTEEKQLHDCGIVYTKRPYLVCIMTKGESFEDLFTVIKSIGMQIYETNIKEDQ